MRAALLALLLVGCEPAASPPLAAPPTARPVNPAPVEQAKPFLSGPVSPKMGEKGLALIVEYEGYALYPEAPDARYSGVSTALGYDWSTVDPSVSVRDWAALPAPAPQRLAATHPYTGRQAQLHLREVKDIKSPRPIGFAVFNEVDTPRFYALCRKAFPGFEELRPNARDALVSLVYNRGAGMVGDNRREMRELPALVKARDYQGMADCERRMIKRWAGTSIAEGMRRRREAEAELILTP